MKHLFYCFLLPILFMACDKEPNDLDQPTNAKIRFQFQFDENQTRLDNLGNETPMPSGNAGQTPDFNALSAYYIELVPTQFTQIREGAVIYEAETQDAESGGTFEKAVTFDAAIVSDEGEVFLEIPIKDIQPGNYKFLRASVTYQNADVKFNLKNLPGPLPPELNYQTGTFAGFIGFNNHINDLMVKDKTIEVNADKTQGFWAFEPQLDAPFQDLFTNYINSDGVITGQAPSGSTTVVNILEAFGVELPFGSCIITGALEGGLEIKGDEREDINLTLSFSINKSFEWIDTNDNGEWDINVQNQNVEQVVDMGLRGLKILKD